MVQEDLSETQKDKFMLQAKVSELKHNMKTLLQQNQQLKLDLRRGAAKVGLSLHPLQVNCLSYLDFGCGGGRRWGQEDRRLAGFLVIHRSKHSTNIELCCAQRS